MTRSHSEHSLRSEKTNSLHASIMAALGEVMDPEIQLPLPELGMVKHLELTSLPEDSKSFQVTVTISLTTPTCPLKNTIEDSVISAVQKLNEINSVHVLFSTMTPEQRQILKKKLRASHNSLENNDIVFNHVGNMTKIYAVSSGKGGVGKSTVTANLAMAFQQQGLKVGIVDADIYGFSIPRLLDVDQRPVKIDGMMIPPVAHGIKVISMGMFVKDSSTAIAWRGPLLHRALEQFLAEVYFGDLDILLIDLPPGTGDVTISIAQLLPHSQVLIVTTPQPASAEVAIRSGSVVEHTGQKIAGVIENMSPMVLPDGSILELFGSGGAIDVANQLTSQTGQKVERLGSIPFEVSVRQGGDTGHMVMLNPVHKSSVEHLQTSSSESENLAQRIAIENRQEVQKEFMAIADKLAHSQRGLSGKSLGINPK